jgi:hypothetical protein
MNRGLKSGEYLKAGKEASEGLDPEDRLLTLPATTDHPNLAVLSSMILPIRRFSLGYPSDEISNPKI